MPARRIVEAFMKAGMTASTTTKANKRLVVALIVKDNIARAFGLIEAAYGAAARTFDQS